MYLRLHFVTCVSGVLALPFTVVSTNFLNKANVINKQVNACLINFRPATHYLQTGQSFEHEYQRAHCHSRGAQYISEIDFIFTTPMKIGH